MAKAGFWLKGAKGKLGGSTLQKGSTGGTIIRSNAESVKNPKTIAQAYQRMVFATVATAKKALSSIVDHAFEGVNYGVESLSYFQRANIAILRAAALNNDTDRNFSIKGARTLVPNRYLVSKGSLPMANFEIVPTTQDNVIIKIAGATQIGSTAPATAQGYINALASMGLEPGDQLTMIAISEDTNMVIAETDLGTGAVNYIGYSEVGRIVFKTVDQISDFTANWLAADGQFNTNYVTRIDGVIKVDDDPTAGIQLAMDVANAPTGGTLIRSKQGSDGKWLRSTAFMLVESSTSHALADPVYLTYMASSSNTNFESDRYLNNALD